MDTKKIQCDQCKREANNASEPGWLRVAAPGSVSFSIAGSYPVVAKSPIDLCSPECREAFFKTVTESKRPEPVRAPVPARVAPLRTLPAGVSASGQPIPPVRATPAES